jgi:HAMP domain-containing protein
MRCDCADRRVEGARWFLEGRVLLVCTVARAVDSHCSPLSALVREIFEGAPQTRVPASSSNEVGRVGSSGDGMRVLGQPKKQQHATDKLKGEKTSPKIETAAAYVLCFLPAG